MMDCSDREVRAFRYWIQGYQNFYEPIIGEYFQSSGYRVLAHPAIVGVVDIQLVVNTLFDGAKRVGDELDEKALREQLKDRKRLQPDFLLERDGRLILAELKSWGGFNRSGQFDLSVLRSEFLQKLKHGAFLLVDPINGQPIAGMLLVVSSRSPEHDQARTTLRRAYRTDVELLHLDEILRTPELAGIIDRQLQYLDVAVAELKQAFTGSGAR